jgi:hypothetical protein
MAQGFHKPGMSKIGWDTTWAKSRARSALDAVLNSGRCGWDALEAKLACQDQDTEGKLEMKKDQRRINPATSVLSQLQKNLVEIPSFLKEEHL